LIVVYISFITMSDVSFDKSRHSTAAPYQVVSLHTRPREK
jgi:hypothetical protein